MPCNEFYVRALWGLDIGKASFWGEKWVCWEGQGDAGF